VYFRFFNAIYMTFYHAPSVHFVKPEASKILLSFHLQVAD
jgi:hypothetical protein